MRSPFPCCGYFTAFSLFEQNYIRKPAVAAAAVDTAENALSANTGGA
jgi:hypothetical protein